MIAYPWPIPPGHTSPPSWTERGLLLDGKPTQGHLVRDRDVRLAR